MLLRELFASSGCIRILWVRSIWTPLKTPAAAVGDHVHPGRAPVPPHGTEARGLPSRDHEAAWMCPPAQSDAHEFSLLWRCDLSFNASGQGVGDRLIGTASSNARHIRIHDVSAPQISQGDRTQY